MQPLQAPDYERASADGLGGKLPDECRWASARIVATASVVTKARRNRAAPMPANVLRGRLTARIRAPVSDPSFSIESERKPLVNTKHPTEETQKSHISDPRLRMRRPEQFIIA